MENPKKFDLKIKGLVILLASGAFAKLHRRFLVPSSETYWGDQVFNSLHHILHTLIGLGIQIVLFLWVINFIIAAGKPVGGEIKVMGVKIWNGIESVWEKRKSREK